MQHIPSWLPFVIVPAVAWCQWWLMRHVERKRIACAKAHHRELQQSAAKLLQQARRQIAQLQQELAAAQMQSKRAARPVPPPPAPQPDARDSLLAMPDDPSHGGLRRPPGGFADTLPSLQFPHASRL